MPSSFENSVNYRSMPKRAMSRCRQLNGWRIIRLRWLIDHQLQEPRLSTADYRPCGLAVFPVPVEPAAGRMLLERGIVGSYETIRRWAANSGQPTSCSCLERSRRGKLSGIWTRVWREASTAMWEPSCTEDEGRSLETDRQG